MELGVEQRQMMRRSKQSTLYLQCRTLLTAAGGDRGGGRSFRTQHILNVMGRDFAAVHAAGNWDTGWDKINTGR